MNKVPLSEDQMAMVLSAQKGDIDQLKEQMKDKDVEHCSFLDKALLRKAAVNDHLDIVKYLSDVLGFSQRAVYAAAYAGHTKIVSYLDGESSDNEQVANIKVYAAKGVAKREALRKARAKNKR